MEKTIGIARTLLSRYERGKHVPSPTALQRLAAFYQVPYDELRILHFEDAFSDTTERDIVMKWACQELFKGKPGEHLVHQILNCLPSAILEADSGTQTAWLRQVMERASREEVVETR
jgi:transcriptional regulator with XRE-family HTH domain